MANGVADHAVNRGLASEFVRAIEIFQFMETNLPGRGGVAHGGVCQRASLAERKDSGG